MQCILCSLCPQVQPTLKTKFDIYNTDSSMFMGVINPQFFSHYTSSNCKIIFRKSKYSFPYHETVVTLNHNRLINSDWKAMQGTLSG